MSANISPHGGYLIDLVLEEKERSEAKKLLKGLKKMIVDDWSLSDLEMIAIGAFSPLTGFMNSTDYQKVLNDMRLSDGTVWTIPVTLPIDENTARAIKVGEQITLMGKDNLYYGWITVEEIFKYDKSEEAEKVYLTRDNDHPGVRRLYSQPPYYLAGPVRLMRRPVRDNISAKYSLDPKGTRQEITRRGWKTVVGFQTRNPIHRAHEYIQKCAMETVDGLLLHPIVGKTKEDDVPPSIRMKSYEVLLEHYYPKDRVLFSVYSAAMRYAGPREAVFHAIVRKNYGCTHFVVGRDHAGVADYYGSYDAHQIFDRFDSKELGIQPCFFEHSFYCKKCSGMASSKTCPHDEQDRVMLSGTKVREMIRSGLYPPKEITRPEVARILIKSLKEY